MRRLLIPARRDAPELMDAPGLPVGEVIEAYCILQRVNRQFFGSLRSMAREMERFLSEDRPGPEAVTVLDVGSGSGDIPGSIRDDLAARRVEATVLALDHDPSAIALASRWPLDAVRGDALRLPFADRSVDLVTAVKFAHHFSGAALDRLIAEMTRVARRRVLVLDIRRHWLAYWGFVAWSRAFTRNRLVRFDGPLSVLRGFIPEELAELAARFPSFAWDVRPYPGFQLALVGQRITSIEPPARHTP